MYEVQSPGYVLPAAYLRAEWKWTRGLLCISKTTYQVFCCHFQRHTQFNPVLQKKENLPSPRNTGLRKPQRLLLQLSSEHTLRLSATCQSGRDQGPQPDLWVSTLLPSRPWTLRNWAGSLVSLSGPQLSQPSLEEANLCPFSEGDAEQC